MGRSRGPKTAGPAGRPAKARTCVACGTTSTKGDLVRFVRLRDGAVVVDATGKVPGRGAYLCPKHECFVLARKRNRLAAALKVPMPPDSYDVLEHEFDRLCAEHGAQE